MSYCYQAHAPGKFRVSCLWLCLAGLAGLVGYETNLLIAMSLVPHCGKAQPMVPRACVQLGKERAFVGLLERWSVTSFPRFIVMTHQI